MKKKHLQVLKYLVILEHSVVQITVKVTKLFVYSYYWLNEKTEANWKVDANWKICIFLD